jgi:hypothetical protein
MSNYLKELSKKWNANGRTPSWKTFMKAESRRLRGLSPKKPNIYKLAKENRKSGQSWSEAVKVASKIIKSKYSNSMKKPSSSKPKVQKNKAVKKNTNDIKLYHISDILPESFEEGQSITLTEKFDLAGAHTIKDSGYCDIDRVRGLQHYINSSKRYDEENNSIKIKYEIGEIGRVYPSHNGESIHSQVFQWAETKKYLCGKLYADVDMKNAHPVLLQQLMEYHGLDTKYINYYNSHREVLLKRIMKRNNITRKEAKTLILKCMYNTDDAITRTIEGKSRIILEETTDTKTGKKIRKYGKKVKLPASVRNFLIQMKYNRLKLLFKYDCAFELQAIGSNNKKNIKREKKGWSPKEMYNLFGSAYSHMGQHLERICLLACVKFFQSKDLEVGALIYDGFHVLKDSRLTPSLLKECSKYVYDNTGFKIELDIKQFKGEEDKSKLKNLIRFDELAGLENISNLSCKRINKQYLTKLNKKDRAGCDLYKHVKEDTITIVKSYTGSGKTCLMEKLIEANRNDSRDYKVLVFASRVTLVDELVNKFGLKHYNKCKEDGLDEVYQLDSISHVPMHKLNEPFVLLIDEVASLCAHFLNGMKTMTQNRRKFVCKFQEIINHKNCRMVLGCDKNTNTGTIKFFRDLSNKQICLWNNVYCKEKPVPVNVYHNKSKIVKTMINMLNNGDNVYLCSNRNSTFFEKVVYPVIKEVGLDESEYLIYASNHGEKNVDVSKWAGKRLVATTPSIIYGIDCKNQFHIFGMYYCFGDQMDAMAMNQQINRERDPSSINLMIEDLKPEKIYNSPEDVKKDLGMDELYPLGLSTPVDEALKNLFFYETYRQSHHLNTKVHLLDLLRQKGYTNITHIIDDGLKIDSPELYKIATQLKPANSRINLSKYSNIRLIEYIKRKDASKLPESCKSGIEDVDYVDILKNKYDNREDDKLCEDIDQKLDLFNLRDSIIEDHTELQVKRDECLKVLENLKFNSFKFSSLLLFNHFVKDNCKDLLMKYEDKNEYYLQNDDILEGTCKSDSFKLFLLAKLRRDFLGIDYKDINTELSENMVINSLTESNMNESINIDDTFRKAFIKVFKIRSKNRMNNDRLTWSCFYLRKLKTVLSGLSVFGKAGCGNKMIDGKRITVPVWNPTIVEYYLKVINFRDEVNKIKKDNRFEFYDHYEFDDEDNFVGVDEHGDRVVDDEDVPSNKEIRIYDADTETHHYLVSV